MHGQLSIGYWSYGSQSWLIKWNAIIFSNSVCVDTALWMHYMDANEMYGEKALGQLHKNATSCIEQVLGARPHKTIAVRPPNTHCENYPS